MFATPKSRKDWSVVNITKQCAPRSMKCSHLVGALGESLPLIATDLRPCRVWCSTCGGGQPALIGPIPPQPLLQCPTSKQNFCVAHFSIQSPQTWALGVANSVASPGQRLSQASSIVQVAARRNLEILYPQQMCGVERGRTFRPSVVVTSGPSGTRGPPPQSGISKFFLNPSHSSGVRIVWHPAQFYRGLAVANPWKPSIMWWGAVNPGSRGVSRGPTSPSDRSTYREGKTLIWQVKTQTQREKSEKSQTYNLMIQRSKN